MRFFLACIVLCCSFKSFADLNQDILDHFCPEQFRNLPISNWEDPSLSDFLMIEKYLKERKMRVAKKLSDKEYLLPGGVDGYVSYRLGRLSITNGEMPKFVKIDFGNDPDAREFCIISYAGLPGGERYYENGMRVMIEALKKLNFKGHLIYRVGGWPNISKGRLRFADVPYAFKPFMFEEVKELGYKYILWLDSACVPIRDLSPVFSRIKKYGYCYYQEDLETDTRLEPWDYIREALKAPKQKKYVNAVTQLVGISSTHPTGIMLLEEWIQAACSRLPFLSPTADQLCFAFLVNKHRLFSGGFPRSIICRNFSKKFELPSDARSAYIYHNYQFIQSKEPPGTEFFSKIPYTNVKRSLEKK